MIDMAFKVLMLTVLSIKQVFAALGRPVPESIKFLTDNNNKFIFFVVAFLLASCLTTYVSYSRAFEVYVND